MALLPAAFPDGQRASVLGSQSYQIRSRGLDCGCGFRRGPGLDRGVTRSWRRGPRGSVEDGLELAPPVGGIGAVILAGQLAEGIERGQADGRVVVIHVLD